MCGGGGGPEGTHHVQLGNVALPLLHLKLCYSVPQPAAFRSHCTLQRSQALVTNHLAAVRMRFALQLEVAVTECKTQSNYHEDYH